MDEKDQPVSNGIVVSGSEESAPHAGDGVEDPNGSIEAVSGYALPEPSVSSAESASAGGPERAAAVDPTLDNFKLDVGKRNLRGSGRRPSTEMTTGSASPATPICTPGGFTPRCSSPRPTTRTGSAPVGSWSPNVLITAGHCVHINGGGAGPERLGQPDPGHPRSRRFDETVRRGDEHRLSSR